MTKAASGLGIPTGGSVDSAESESSSMVDDVSEYCPTLTFHQVSCVIFYCVFLNDVCFHECVSVACVVFNELCIGKENVTWIRQSIVMFYLFSEVVT